MREMLIGHWRRDRGNKDKDKANCSYILDISTFTWESMPSSSRGESKSIRMSLEVLISLQTCTAKSSKSSSNWS